MFTVYHGYILSLTAVAIQLQIASTLSLSLDTLKTINGNQVFEKGYHESKHSSKEQGYYSGSSSRGLTRLAEDEIKIFQAFSNEMKCASTPRGNTFSQIIQEYVEDYEATSGALISDQRHQDGNKAAEVAGDLMAAYRMVRRFRNKQDLFRALSRTNASSFCSPEFLGILQSLESNGTKGPFRKDFHMIMFAIIFTQLQLGWKPVDISQGKIKGMELGTSLKAVHCVEIGVHAVASRVFPVGIEWLELAVTKIQDRDKTSDFNFALSSLHKSIAEHDKYWQQETPWDSQEVFYKARLNDTKDNRAREWPSQFNADSRFFDNEKYTDITWDICSRKIQQTEAEKSKLFCWHETQIHPTWKLGPLKAELLGRYPLEVLQFHHVLNDASAQRVKNGCAKSVGLKSIQQLLPKYRLAEDCYIRDKKMYRITERITGLNTQHSSNVPVVLYPPGGHFRLHLDRYGDESLGKVFATVIYFLDAPDVGGETVLPDSKVLVTPIKGSAILFYNLLQSSKMNTNAKHGACPLVKGHKWIGTNWVDYDGQPHLACDRDENSMTEYLVNGKSKYKFL